MSMSQKAAANRRRNSRLLAGYAANPASIPNPNRRVPPRPPAGMYDPGLDASQRAAGRGFNDLRQDLDRDGQRSSTAYTLGMSRFGEDEAFETGGLDQAQARLGQDHTRATAALGRSFQILGSNQAQAGAAAGLGGGFAAQAARKRAANQGIEQQGLDLQRDRGTEDITRQRGRMATMFGRAREDAGSDFQYGQDDRAMALARGGRENTFYGQDVADQRFFQASQAGWRPAAKPKKKKGKR
jgi:hypothetical protein